MTYDLDWLAAQGAWDGIFFWGHRQKTPGVVDKSCCSQWFPAGFTVDGVDYPTAEHWMMAGKARLFGDENALSRILQTPDPSKVKAIGRTVRGFDRDAWTAHARGLVRDGNIEKFGQNARLEGWLRGTGRRVLVEASPHDRIWGIGLAPDDPNVRTLSKWRGKNWLGFAIMEARDALSSR